MVLLFWLVADPFSALFPHGVMEFLVPGLVAAGLFTWVIYKLLKEFNLIDGI